MIQTVMRMSALAGAPAGKPRYTNHSMPCSGLLWLGCALAAMGMAQAAPQPSVETVLHAFANAAPNGGTPGAGLIEDQAGNLYGTTSTGGSAGAGEVFKVYPGGHLSVLYSFTGGADGGNPYSPLIRDPAGNLYGTASAGGTAGRARRVECQRARLAFRLRMPFEINGLCSPHSFSLR